MTALNPSHVPGLHETADRTTGRAVYDSVSTFFPHGPDVAGDAALTPSLLSSLGDRGIPSKQRRRRRLSSDYGRGSLYGAAEKVPVPPIPDLRYEQGVLASLQPFLHRVPASPNSSTNHTSTPQETEKHARKVDSAEKATLAARDLTAEGGPDTADRPSDIFLGPLRIEWSRVAYVIVRDQVISPLVQGILWGVAGFYLSALWNWNKARIAAQRSGYPAGRPSLLASLGIRTR